MKMFPRMRWLSRLLLFALLGMGAGPGWAQGVEWASNAANSNLDANSHAYQVVVDAAGNTYVAGGSSLNATIGGIAPAAQLGTGLLFVAKRNPAGQTLWVRRGGAVATIPLGLALDGADQPVVTGTFTNPAAFGGTTLTSAGGTDGFVARLDAAGNWLSAVRLGGPRNDQPGALAVQPDGTAYVTGTFIETASFGSLPALVMAGSPSYDVDIFVARLSPANAWTWAIRAGAAGPDDANGLALDGAGRLTVSGSFRDSIQFGSQPWQYARGHRNQGNTDIFVAQLTAATGTWQWATRAGGPGNDVGYGLAVDAAGTISLAGTFRDTLDFGNDSLALPRLPSRGEYDALVARLSAGGTWLWATGAGGTGGNGSTIYGDVALAVAVDPAGTRTTVTGRYSGTATFGTLPALVSTSVLSLTFVGQVAGADGHWLNVVSLGTVGNNQPGGVALSADGHVYAAGTVTRSVYFGTALSAVSFFSPAGFPGFPSSANTLAYAARLAPDAGTWDQVLVPDHGGNLEIRAVAHDAAGNSYVAGRFDGSPTFATPAGLVRLINPSNQSAFMGKLNPAGEWQWVRQSEGVANSREEGATGIAIDGSGRVTVAGYFESATFRLGSLTAPGRAGAATATAAITNTSGLAANTVFVAQLDAATGAVSWLNSLQSTDNVIAFGLSRDPLTDDLTVAGTFSGTISTGSGGLTATATGTYNALLARLSAAGTWQWLRHVGGASTTSNGARNNAIWTSVRQDTSGAYALCGLLEGQAIFGSQTVTGTTGSSALPYVPLVARLNAAGNAWLWTARPGGGTTYSGRYGAVAPDAAGNVYYTDQFNSGTLLRKYSPTGSLLWSVNGSDSNVIGTSLAVDAAGEPTLLGEYYQTATFGSRTLTTTTDFGLYAAHLSSAGAWRWATSLGPVVFDGVNIRPTVRSAEVVDAGGTILLGGYFTAVPLGPLGTTTVSRSVVARLLSPPVITTFTPGAGSIGTVVVLTGTGFTDASGVAFNGTPAPGFVVSNGGTTITVSAPVGVTTGPITVTSAGGTGSSPSNFVVPTAATAVVWTGAVDTRWELPGNWLPAVVPTAITSVSIPPVPNQPVVTTAAACAGLTLAFGGTSLTIAELPTPGYLTVAGDVAAHGELRMSGGTLELQGDLTLDQAFVPTGGTVVLSSPGSQQVGTNGRPTNFWNLTVQPHPNGTAAIYNAARVRRILRLQGNLTMQSSALTLVSDATGTGMVVNEGGQISSFSYMERFISGPNAGAGYRHFSSPMSTTTVGSLLNTNPAPVLNAAYNTVGNTVRPFPTFFGFDEARQGAASVSGPVGFDQGWVSPASTNDALVPGRGYTANLAGTTRPVAAGVFNTGPVAVGALSRGGTGPFAGYHLLGNPYPSPIDWDNVARPAGLDNAVYVFRSTSQYAGFYDSYVNGIGTLAGGEIVAMQGFFVRVSQAVPAFSFTDAARLTTYSNPTFRRGGADTRPQLRLELHPASGGDADATFVYFEAGATPGYDPEFDAAKLPNPGSLSLATATGSNTYAVNGLPLLASRTVLPLVLVLPTAGTYTLTAAQLQHFAPGQAIYLTDALTGTRHDLGLNPDYRFSAPAATLAGRFALVFGPAGTALGAAAAQAAALTLYPNPAHSAATLTLPAAAVARPVVVLDALGRELRRALLPANSTEVRLNLSGLPAGVYLVRCGEATARLVLE